MVSFMMRVVLLAFMAANLTAKCHGLTYDVTEIKPDGVFNIYASEMNNHGEFIGVATTPSLQTEYVVYRNGKVEYVKHPGGTIDELAAINDRGEVVGTYTTDDQRWHAFIYREGKFDDLCDLELVSFVADINDSGQAVGYASVYNTAPKAALFENGQVVYIGDLGGESSGQSINNLGSIIGSSRASTFGKHHAFLYRNGVMQDIGTALSGHSFAMSINDMGVALCYVIDPLGQLIYYTFAEGQITMLSPDFYANSMNNHGVAVGTIQSLSISPHGCIYDNGLYTDLNSCLESDVHGMTIHNAMSINDLGQIMCEAYSDSGDSELWLLTPRTVPEPASVLVMAVPSLLLVVRRQKKRSTVN